ncbi:unnamed protein product [Brassicogethes aeneus]|uniref:Uncharacterized protein n=1 Tax=Brassicogethes aeneus TaxID=1431903 RepID=A0A9P0FEL9_BRAAE|nr:unnamed protein product [Brassicogethes aeneus]
MGDMDKKSQRFQMPQQGYPFMQQGFPQQMPYGLRPDVSNRNINFQHMGIRQQQIPIPNAPRQEYVGHSGFEMPQQQPHMIQRMPTYVQRPKPKPEYKVFELNKLLQQRPENADNQWWDVFASEFFEDDATLTISFNMDNENKSFKVKRTLIPRYFKSIYEGGVTDLTYSLRHTQESYNNTGFLLRTDHCTVTTHHSVPLFTKVCTEGSLIIHFSTTLKIKSWHFNARSFGELISRSILGMQFQQNQGMFEQISKNITSQGVTNSTLNYLRMSEILQPMQDLMVMQKSSGLSPKDCLNTMLNQNQKEANVEKPASPNPNSRRKRKSANREDLEKANKRNDNYPNMGGYGNSRGFNIDSMLN